MIYDSATLVIIEKYLLLVNQSIINQSEYFKVA